MEAGGNQWHSVRKGMFPTASVSAETFGDLEGWGWELAAHRAAHLPWGEAFLRKSSQLAQDFFR